ncbi:MAG: hypothetical protein CL610_14615 [Anaerolineaceae bacterium]|nr:hypothetical protein [Anaerolineaceae bacterium]
MNGFTQPRLIGEGLQLRHATEADAEALSQINTEIFDQSVGDSVAMMVSGRHPTVGPKDFILIEDVNHSHKIAASGAIFDHLWRYGDVVFKMGYLECIVTHPDYRRRGLMRNVIEALHTISTSKGHLVQTVGGIRWFYRRFGYEYALDGPGHRELPLTFVPLLAEGETEPYTIRLAQEADIPTLIQLYERQCAGKLITRLRPEAWWRYHISGQDHGAFSETYLLILDSSGSIAGYFGTWAGLPWGRRYVRELGVQEGVPIHAVLPSVQRYIYTFLDDNEAAFGGYPPLSIQFDLGFNETHQHPVYELLGGGLTRYRGWSWYVRVVDIPGFIMHIAQALNQRLAASDMSGYDGDLKISFYRGGVRLFFERGQLIKAEDWASPEIDEGHDAAFPPHTFLQILFGYRSLAELRYAFPDCWVNRKAILMLDTLFPKQSSWAFP